MKKFFKRLAASLFAAIFLLTQYPILTHGLASENKKISPIKEPEILSEVVEKREEFVKHFRMSDGSMMAIVYSDQVHYKDDKDENKFKEIDNTLIEDDQEYKNTDSPLKVRIPKNFNDKKLVTLNSEGHEISWSYIKKNRKLKNTESDTNAKTTETTDELNYKPEAALIENFKTKDKNFASKKEERTDISKVYSRAKYKKADPEIDLDYTVSSTNLKENIILNKKLEFTENDSFDFEFKTNNLKIKKDDSGNLNFVDENNKIIFVMPKGSMWDSSENSAFSNDIDYKFKEVEGGYIISVIPNLEWLNDKDRIYPIFIDPSITIESKKSIHNTQASATSPDANFSTLNHISVGRRTANEYWASFVKCTELPNLLHGEIITNAQLKLKSFPTSFAYEVSPNNKLCVKKVTKNWDQSTLTWNNRPRNDEIIRDYLVTSSSTMGQWHNWDVTGLAKEWYNSDDKNQNNGVEVYTLTNDLSILRFISTRNTDYPNDKPRFEISYRNFIGEENYWSYTDHNAGLNGYGKVNNYAGTLSLSENVLSYSGSRNPVSILNTYNNSNYNEHANSTIHLQNFSGGYSHSASTGLGWSLDFNQLIYPLPSSDPMYSASGGNFRYVHIDDDGTWHYFKLKDPNNSSNTDCIDEDGLSFTIKEVGGNLELIDKVENKLVFKKQFTNDACYALDSSQDSDGNETKYFYDYQPGTPNSKVSKIQDAAGRETHIAYDITNGMVSEITEADGSKTTFTYDGQKLKEITYPDGLKTGYVYDMQGRLSRVWTDEGTGNSVVYQYASNDFRSSNFFKIRNVTEYGSQNADPRTAGNSVDFEYSMNQTKITHKINNLDVPYYENTEIWQFDNNGRTTGVMDENGNMLSNIYETATDGRKHKVKHSNDTGKYTNNLLKNTAANNGMANWTVNNWDQSHPEKGDTTWDISTDTSQISLGTQSFKIKQSCGSFPVLEQKINIQKLSLPKKYTLSADVKIIGNLTDSGNGASLHLAAFNGATQLAGDTYSESIYSTDSITSTPQNEGWRRISVTFEAPTGTDTIACYASIHNSNGEAYFDCFQLEEGEFANDYNAVENSSFDNGFDSWEKYHLGTLDIIESGRLKVIGDPNQGKAAYQDILINKVNPVLAIRATAQGSTVPNKGASEYDVACYLNFEDGFSCWEHIYFNPNVTDTQSVYGSIVANDYHPGVKLTSVKIEPNFNFNCNTVYFDNIQVCIDDFGATYDRNDKGSIESVLNNAGNKTTITRNPNSDEITKIKDTRNYESNFEYNSSKPHELSNSTIPTPGGSVKTNFVHDSFGNITGSQTQDASGLGKIVQNSATYTSLGNYSRSVTDSRGKTTTFDHNENNGNLNSTVNSRQVTINCLYDAASRITSATCNGSEVNYTYTNGVLSSVAHKLSNNVNVAYNFTRDIFGKITQSKVGNQVLTKNTYDAGNGLLSQVKYNNNQQVKFDYDRFGRLIKRKYHSGKNKPNGGFEYVYDNKNRLIQIFDEENNLTTKFEYDMYGRIAYIRRSDGVTSDIKYNALESLVDKTTSKIFEVTQTIENTFGGSDILEHSEITVGNNSIWHKYAYDTLSRVQSTETLNSDETTGLKHEITYLDVDTSNTTNLINSIELKKKVSGNWIELGKKYSYTYDDVSNITDIRDINNNLLVHYEYDDFNQLVRENNVIVGKTITYTYDLGGNIQEKKIYGYTTGDLDDLTPENTVVYGYADSNWKDRMTSYNGQKLIYDGIGNPLVYRDGMKFEWVRGRELEKVSKTGYNVTYKYGDRGIRTQKTVNGITTDFVTSGIQVLAQKCGNDVITWQIDGNGSVTGFDYNNTTYFYIKNAQGDIVGITDNLGNIITEYIYDSWGKLVSITGSNTEIGEINPLRYRGYYYDSETGLYYLNARYYDPETGRFVSADSNLEGGLNLFGYCHNNPVMGHDPTGNYNVELALEYAAKWWNHRNLDYYSYSRGDCANFVNQCLFAGRFYHMNGLGRDSGWHSYKNVKKSVLGIKFYEWDVSASWSTVRGMIDWLNDKSNLYHSILYIKDSKVLKNCIERKWIQAGDVAFMSTDYNSEVTHAVLIGRVTSDNVYYYGHTNNRNAQKNGHGFAEYFKGEPAKKKGGAYIIIYRLK